MMTGHIICHNRLQCVHHNLLHFCDTIIPIFPVVFPITTHLTIIFSLWNYYDTIMTRLWHYYSYNFSIIFRYFRVSATSWWDLAYTKPRPNHRRMTWLVTRKVNSDSGWTGELACTRKANKFSWQSIILFIIFTILLIISFEWAGSGSDFSRRRHKTSMPNDSMCWTKPCDQPDSCHNLPFCDVPIILIISILFQLFSRLYSLFQYSKLRLDAYLLQKTCPIAHPQQEIGEHISNEKYGLNHQEPRRPVQLRILCQPPHPDSSYGCKSAICNGFAFFLPHVIRDTEITTNLPKMKIRKIAITGIISIINITSIITNFRAYPCVSYYR